MSEVIQVTVKKDGERIDKYLSQELSEFSRSQIQDWLKNKLVEVNQQTVKANYKVKDGDHIIIHVPEEKELALIPQNLPLEIVYEDEDLVVINKEQGMVVHPSSGHPEGTLVNALLYHIQDLSSINGVVRPGIVHRIDKDTSGLLVVAKNDAAHEKLSNQLKERKAERQYLALVHGDFIHEKGTINAPIARSPINRKSQAVVAGGKEAVTHFTVLERFGDYTLVECQLETGRTHQIRVHMQYINHPVAGDPLYGPKKTLKGKGQFLHAKSLGFVHPMTGNEMYFECELPEVFQSQLVKLREDLSMDESL